MEKLLWLWISLGVVALLVTVGITWYLVISNQFKKDKQSIQTTMLNMESFIQSKYDLLQQLIRIIQHTLLDDTTLLEQNKDIKYFETSHTALEKQEVSNQVTNLMQSMYTKIQTNPKLKTSKEVTAILENWIIMEESLESVRKLYNQHISNYNRKLVTFPSRYVGMIKRYKKHAFFETQNILSKQSSRSQ